MKVPVLAAGGIADTRGIAAAFTLGAATVQIGTAHLLCPEAKTVRRQALSSGFHYLQEDHPDVIGTTVKEWLIDMGTGSSSKHQAAV